MFIGQRLMNVLNPAPRLTMLSAPGRTALAHETWQGRYHPASARWSRQGGSATGSGNNRKAVEAPIRHDEQAAGSGTALRLGEEAEDKKDKQKTAERVVVR